MARKAAVYDFKLCRAILAGFRDQLRHDGLYKDGFMGLMEDRADRPNSDTNAETIPIYHLTSSNGSVLRVAIQGDEIFKDDLTGQLLPPDLVVKMARKQDF